MKNGRIRKKSGFTAVSNDLVKDRALSLKAKGLYMLIQSFVVIPNFDLYLNTLKKEVKEGEHSFMGAWKELKDNGYLVQYRSRGQDGKFIWEYELLDKPSPEHRGSIHPPKNHPMENPPHGKLGGYNKKYLNNRLIDRCQAEFSDKEQKEEVPRQKGGTSQNNDLE